MTTNLSDSHDAKAEIDHLWAQWVGDSARRKRDRQKAVTQVAVVIAIALAIWVAMLLVGG